MKDDKTHCVTHELTVSNVAGENGEKINGQANRLQIIQNTLFLRDNVIIFRQGNEIKTQEVKIILKEND